MLSKVRVVVSVFRKYIKYNIAFALLSIFTIIITYISPLLNAKIIDEGIQNNNKKILVICLLFLFGIACLSEALAFIVSFVRIKYQYVISRDIKNKVINYFFYGFNKNKRINSESELDTLIRSDISKFISYVSDNVQNIVLAFLKLIVMIVIVLKIQFVLGISIIGFQVFYVLLNKYINKKLEEISAELRDSYVEQIQKINEIIQHIKELLILNGVNYMLKKYNDSLYKSYSAQKKNSKYMHLSVLFSSIMEVVLQCFIIGFGGWLIIDGKLSIGLLISFMSYSSMLKEAIGELLSVWTDYSEEKESLDIVFEIISDINNMKITDLKSEKIDINRLELRNLSFSYDDNRKILHNVNIVFYKDNINYIVGKSGMGKTTLLKILLGYLEVNNGAVIYGARNIKKLIEENSLVNYISWVPQEPILFADTIRNNILLGNEMDEKKLVEVCKKCALYDDIMQLQDGFDTILGDNGEKLSVGQKHRLGLVRALLQEKPILLIDEATAGLDTVTERHIRDNLMKLCKGRLTIIVTHSPQFIVEGATVYELNNSHITMTGKERK